MEKLHIEMVERTPRVAGPFALAHTLLLSLDMPESKGMRDRQAMVTSVARMLANGNETLAGIVAMDATIGLFPGVYV